MLAVGHVLTGIIAPCAPSLADELGGYSAILQDIVSNGYAVAMSDYEGLGLEGLQHLPLQAATLGNNLIDSVRAARHILPTASTRWAAYGIGQGGLAAWAAADRASTYGAGLEMVGAVALSPFASMSGIADAAEQGTLAREQYYLYLAVVQSFANSPARLNVDDYTTPRVKENVDVDDEVRTHGCWRASRCGCGAGTQRHSTPRRGGDCALAAAHRRCGSAVADRRSSRPGAGRLRERRPRGA